MFANSINQREELGIFESYIRRCRRKNLNDTITYLDEVHALFALKELLDLAHQERYSVKIIDKTFNPDFYMELAKDITRCMDNGSIVKAICSDPKTNLKDNKFINMIINHSRGDFKQDFRNNQEIASLCFTLVGDKSYRLMSDLEEGRASLNFNDKEIGDYLEDDFDKYYESL